MSGPVVVHPEVQTALMDSRPVVALESAVITCGLPRQPLSQPECNAPGWQRDQPMNLATATLLQRIVREGGAVPATVAVLDGRLHIGLEERDLARLADDVTAKVSTSTLAHTLATGASAGTTVAATLAACRLTSRPIRVFATGGIGGVHQNWQSRPDISADLQQLANTRTCTVCAGAKAILDLPATLEALEALGVPVVGYATDMFPQFQFRGSADLPAPRRVDDVRAAAQLCCVHWNNLGERSGIVLANPIPANQSVDREVLQRASQEAERRADDAGVIGEARTPYLLSCISDLTNGRSLQANLALLSNNVALAAALAGELIPMIDTTQ